MSVSGNRVEEIVPKGRSKVQEEGPVVPERKRIAVAVCTYKRNEPLTVLLHALTACAERIKNRGAVGVVIIDDTADGQARAVVEEFAGRFELGLAYRISGKQNISIARNLALETALDIGDWIAMTDDDCEPPSQWLEVLLDLQQRTGADAVTGRIVRRAPDDAPAWITDQPFLDLGVEVRPDGSEMTVAATFNTLISSRWLRAHPQIRFDPNMGVVGGEDMVFFRAAHAAGLRICFSELGFVYENEPRERATFGYQLYVYFWHGNSAALACVENGMKRWRVFVHGTASFIRAGVRPMSRLLRGQKPQLRFCLAQILHAAGKQLGAAGVRIEHR
jgi:glycosyltransferase involved in cell wall biosynthesis